MSESLEDQIDVGIAIVEIYLVVTQTKVASLD
jgi:hypothetical protein